MRQLDVVFVHPGEADVLYQSLSVRHSAIEPPTWALLLAESCRAKGYGVAILDCDAERLGYAAAVARIREFNPRLVCFVVYGQNPNIGTTKMAGVVGLAERLRAEHPQYRIAVVGSHASALPLEVLAIPAVDIVFLNEGVYALHHLLATDLRTDLQNVKGIGWKDDGRPVLNEPERVVPTERMDHDLPGYAWDLLPKRDKPLDLYRSCNWHANFDESRRTPYATIQTSLGCRFKCDFCMINIVNRVDNREGVTAADSAGMRFWSPAFVMKQFDKLAELGARTIRIVDEMFFLDQRYFDPIVTMLGERDYSRDLLMWAYARVDTVRPKYLEKFRRAGIHWLALGIESTDKTIRREITKGTFEETDIKQVCRDIQAAGISVIGNYIFGLPDDTWETMSHTLEVALELQTEMANMYPCFALPGSPLYYQALRNGWPLPQSYAAWSFYSYECQPLPTRHLSAADVLRFRDRAWDTYFRRPAYHDFIEKRFGVTARQYIQDLTAVRLRRKLLGD